MQGRLRRIGRPSGRSGDIWPEQSGRTGWETGHRAMARTDPRRRPPGTHSRVPYVTADQSMGHRNGFGPHGHFTAPPYSSSAPSLRSENGLWVLGPNGNCSMKRSRYLPRQYHFSLIRLGVDPSSQAISLSARLPLFLSLLLSLSFPYSSLSPSLFRCAPIVVSFSAAFSVSDKAMYTALRPGTLESVRLNRIRHIPPIPSQFRSPPSFHVRTLRNCQACRRGIEPRLGSRTSARIRWSVSACIYAEHGLK